MIGSKWDLSLLSFVIGSEYSLFSSLSLEFSFVSLSLSIDSARILMSFSTRCSLFSRSCTLRRFTSSSRDSFDSLSSSTCFIKCDVNCDETLASSISRLAFDSIWVSLWCWTSSSHSLVFSTSLLDTRSWMLFITLAESLESRHLLGRGGVTGEVGILRKDTEGPAAVLCSNGSWFDVKLMRMSISWEQVCRSGMNSSLRSHSEVDLSPLHSLLLPPATFDWMMSLQTAGSHSSPAASSPRLPPPPVAAAALVMLTLWLLSGITRPVFGVSDVILAAELASGLTWIL